ncbi:MAG: penicillin-binding protein 1A [Solibacterales bacterium]|nr:penicillin-binding protein 1A [Bryobacterales bacterium]
MFRYDGCSSMTPFRKAIAVMLLVALCAGIATVSHFYLKYSKLIDAKLSQGPFNRTSKILAAPQVIYIGDEVTPQEIVSLLRKAGYSELRTNRIGYFVAKEDSLEIYPGGMSYFRQEPVALYFHRKAVERIISLSDNNPQTAYELEPELITNLFDQERSKRRILTHSEIPQVLIDAVIAIEDHRFFDHYGFDLIRMAKAAYDGFIVEGRRPRGTSTLTQQLARGFFLTPEQTYARKLAELMIALQLEARLSKEKILEHYLNQVNLGRRGSFNVLGMGEAARVYFDKDTRELTLAEAALLAGLIQRPSYLNPYRHPERAKNRRRSVLQAMLRDDVITDEQFTQADQDEVHLAVGKIESSAAPYFVDLVNNQLKAWFTPDELITQSYWVYTTLDVELQEAAVEAVRTGMAMVDERVARQKRFRNVSPPKAQVALVALDPATGEVKAVVGGRNYGLSQLNRVLASRQPGSTFKPFVYAAAVDTAIPSDLSGLNEDHSIDNDDDQASPVSSGENNHTLVPNEGFVPRQVLTPISTVDDVPTTFYFDDQYYEPSNFANKIYGEVTVRQALYKSMNIATVKVAEMVGFERVAEIARRVGLGAKVLPTPAISLGAYEATPLEIAGAYTALANAGEMMMPYFVRTVRDRAGSPLVHNQPQGEKVLDPRVAYIVTHMLQDVIRRGTAVRVRAMGFTEPSAGKTGTDDDGWFAGFTSNLLCIVWVGFDDNTDLKVEGSKSALPIWAEFMKRAHELREYRNPKPFEPAQGVVTLDVDPVTQRIATYQCPKRSAEVFIAGSQPMQYCRLHGGRGQRTLLATNVAGWDNASVQKTSSSPETEVVQSTGRPESRSSLRRNRALSGSSKELSQETSPQKKKGFFSRFLDIFR